LGDEKGVKGKGSGKVLKSGPKDDVFINFVDHGATGILGFPSGMLTADQLNQTLVKMHQKRMYGKLTLYIEACESGSIFRNILPSNVNIFATTASDYDESSYACYFDDKRQTYLGDVYSVNWMEDSDKENLDNETLQSQFEIVKKLTTTSRVQEYGDLTMSKLPVGYFQGESEAQSPKRYPKVPFTDVSPSWDVPINILYKRIQAAKTDAERENLQKELDEMHNKRFFLDNFVMKIVRRVAKVQDHQTRLVAFKPQRLTDLACHHRLVNSFNQYCFDFSKHTYAMKYAYVFANMCEQGFDANKAVQIMKDVCRTHTVNFAQIL